MEQFIEETLVSKKAFTIVSDVLAEIHRLNNGRLADDMVSLLKKLKRRKHSESNILELKLNIEVYYSTIGKYDVIHLSRYDAEHFYFAVILNQNESKDGLKLLGLRYYEEFDSDCLNYISPSNQIDNKMGDIFTSLKVINWHSDNANNNKYIRRPDMAYIEENIEQLMSGKGFNFFKAVCNYPIDYHKCCSISSISDMTEFYLILDMIDI